MCTAPMQRAAFLHIGTIVRHPRCQATKMANKADDFEGGPRLHHQLHLFPAHVTFSFTMHSPTLVAQNTCMVFIATNSTYMPAHLARLSTYRRREYNAPSLIFRIVYSSTFCDNRTGLGPSCAAFDHSGRDCSAAQALKSEAVASTQFSPSNERLDLHPYRIARDECKSLCRPLTQPWPPLLGLQC